MLKIGLTGGVGCGKSTICDQFSRLAVPIIDADVIAHSLVDPGSPALGEIRKKLGDQLITTDGHLDRQQLRQMILTQPSIRNQLEAILHPRIHRVILDELSSAAAAYVIICIPLLLEVAWTDLVDRILVVDCSEEDQIQRLLKRDQSSLSEIRQLISLQIDRPSRLKAADDIIYNNGSIQSLEPKITRLHKKYQQLAAK